MRLSYLVNRSQKSGPSERFSSSPTYLAALSCGHAFYSSLLSTRQRSRKITLLSESITRKWTAHTKRHARQKATKKPPFSSAGHSLPPLSNIRLTPSPPSHPPQLVLHATPKQRKTGTRNTTDCTAVVPNRLVHSQAKKKKRTRCSFANATTNETRRETRTKQLL